jgi:hypothetical protein
LLGSTDHENQPKVQGVKKMRLAEGEEWVGHSLDKYFLELGKNGNEWMRFALCINNVIRNPDLGMEWSFRLVSFGVGERAGPQHAIDWGRLQ